MCQVPTTVNLVPLQLTEEYFDYRNIGAYTQYAYIASQIVTLPEALMFISGI